MIVKTPGSVTWLAVRAVSFFLVLLDFFFCSFVSRTHEFFWYFFLDKSMTSVVMLTKIDFFYLCCNADDPWVVVKISKKCTFSFSWFHKRQQDRRLHNVRWTHWKQLGVATNRESIAWRKGAGDSKWARDICHRWWVGCWMASSAASQGSNSHCPECTHHSLCSTHVFTVVQAPLQILSFCQCNTL